MQSKEYRSQGCAALRRAKELHLARAQDKAGVPDELVDLLAKCEPAAGTR